jgi:hypothetical protein
MPEEYSLVMQRTRRWRRDGIAVETVAQTNQEKPEPGPSVKERIYFGRLSVQINESQEKTVQTSSCWRRSPWPMQAVESCGQLNSQRRSVRQV